MYEKDLILEQAWAHFEHIYISTGQLNNFLHIKHESCRLIRQKFYQQHPKTVPKQNRFTIQNVRNLFTQNEIPNLKIRSDNIVKQTILYGIKLTDERIN